jgi:hypothetical protein
MVRAEFERFRGREINTAGDGFFAVFDGPARAVRCAQSITEGAWRLFVFWMHGTGQTASPSATVNYTVNYLDRAGVEAVIDYWDSVVLTPELRAQIARSPRTQMYMDSLELSVYGDGGMFWGLTVAEEFQARRGYDITPWLPFLISSAPFFAVSTVYHNEPTEQHRITVEKVRFDYVRTLTDLYIENMLRPFAEFLHANGMTLRAEISYGLPFELTRPGPEVDGIETESLEFGAQIDAYRLLAGPAHLFGKQFSSETGATTRNHILDHRFYEYPGLFFYFLAPVLALLPREALSSPQAYLVARGVVAAFGVASHHWPQPHGSAAAASGNG